MATTQASVAKAILGAGGARFDIYDPDSQTYGGLGDLIETDKFAITPDSDLKQKTSKSRAAYGQSIAAVTVGKPTKIEVTLSSASHEAMAMQFQGIVTARSQGAGAINDTITAQLDKWAQLSKRNVVDTAFTVAGGTTEAPIPYAKDTDYQVNYATGEIKPLSSGAIPANATLTVTGTALAYSSTVVSGGVRPQIRARIVWEGINQVDGQEIEAEAFEAILASGGAFDFLADDFPGVVLTGTLVIPDGQSAPYEIRFKDPS